MLAETVATASQRGHESDVVRLNHASDDPAREELFSAVPRGRPCLGWEVRTGQGKTKKQDGLPAGGRPETDHGALGPGLGLADPHSRGRGIVRRKTEAAQAAQAAALRLSLCRGWRPQK